MKIVVLHDSHLVGPFDEEIIAHKLASRELSPNDHAKYEGETNWKPLHSICTSKVPVDHLISAKDSGGSYAPFDMCPFVMAEIGGSLSVGGLGGGKYTWTHMRCIRQKCRLWTYKFDESNNFIAEGCNMQFIGLTTSEIKKNFEMKNEAILKSSS
jgi:hypothetical protein